MRRAIVHIGMPRTGSTSFQTMLSRLRPHLAGVGLSYPNLNPAGGPPGDFVHHQPLAEALDGRRPSTERADSLARLAQALAETPADTVILSYEDFALQKPGFGVPALLREIFARRGFAMEVLLVVKPVAEQLNSAYGLRAQVLRETRSFRDFARAFWWSGWFDYGARLEPWRAAAEDRVTVVPLRDRRSEAPLLARLVQDLGLSERLDPLLAGTDMRFATNRSPGPVAVEASRRLCKLRVQRQFRGHPRHIGHALDDAARARGLDPELFQGDAPEQIARMEAHFAPANERFAESVWGAPWDQVMLEAPRPPNELAGRPSPPQTEAEIAAVMEAVVGRFGFRLPPAWQAKPLALAEEAGERLARRIGYPVACGVSRLGRPCGAVRKRRAEVLR